MDSILVFDDFKHCFRELDTSNYNDDLVVGSVFFTRDAINVIEKYYRIIGYIICDDKGVYYPIDVRKNDIAILEGTYNCIEDELKKELVPYNIKIEPAEVWSPFFFRWQFMCDWNVFETCGDFINIASKIIGNERLMKKIIDDKIDYVLPVNYKELSQMVRGLIYFADKYGAGSAHDCNGYTVMRFLRKVLVSFSEHNPKAGIIDTICKAVVQCLEWDKTRFIPEFNRLFCISNAHADFLKVAEYWCGEDGVAWRSEYDEMEDLCKNMIPALEYFGENKFIEEVREKQKYRMFGYVGRNHRYADVYIGQMLWAFLTQENF